MDYFNAKIYLLFQEIEYLSKKITEIKGFYKSILLFLKEYKDDLLKVRFLNSKLKNLFDVLDNIREQNNVDNITTNINITENDNENLKKSKNIHKNFKKK